MDKKRIQIHELTDKAIIKIPAKKYYWAASFSFIWLSLWFVCLVILSLFLYILLASGASWAGLFFYMFFSIWLAIGLIAFYKFAWVVSGKEIITVTSDLLSVKYTFFNLGITRHYLINNISDIKLAMTKKIPVYNRQWKFGIKNFGNIEFKYQSRYYYAGVEIDWIEAQTIINIIEKYKYNNKA